MADGRSRNGGKRPGSGRKSRAERFDKPIAAAEKRIAARLPFIIDTLFRLAEGGYERVKEEWQPAGLILIDTPVRDPKGNPVRDDKGKVQKARQSAFPDLDPETLVLVKRQREIADGDREANTYLADRILGKPTQSVEAEVAGPGGAPIPIAIQSAIEKVYGAEGGA